MKFSAMRPPENSLIIHIGFSVSRICSPTECFPETSCHFFSTDISPAMLDISFICDLIQNYRFFVTDPPLIYHLGGLVKILSLNAAVSDPRSCIIIETLAIVNGTKMIVYIFFLDNSCVTLPVLSCLFREKIVLIGK